MNHNQALNIAKSGLFGNIKKIEELDAAIVAYSKRATGQGLDTRENRCGMAFEVYAEFWLTKIGPRGMNIYEVTDTSSNVMNKGVDFTFIDAPSGGKRGIIQCKYRSNPMHEFTQDDLSTFIYEFAIENLSKNNSVLFTNCKKKDPFHSSFDKRAVNRIRLIGRDCQLKQIMMNDSFWSDFSNELTQIVLISQQTQLMQIP